MRISTLLSSISRRLLVFAALAALVLPVSAQVRGTVLDTEGEPLPGATVVLREASSGLQRYGTATGEDGAFLLAEVQPGRYDLLVSYVGFATHTEPLAVDVAGVADLTIRLSSYTAQQPDVVVTATRARPRLTPITFSAITAQELEELPDMKDLPVLLSTLPSITYYSENGNGMGYTYLQMRGFNERRLGVTINGIPQNDPEDFSVYWINFFDLQGTIQDIQVQRGAGSAVYGPAAIGGAVNIVAMPYRPQPFARAQVGYGAYETQRYTVEANTGLMGGRYVAYGRYSRLLSDGYRDWSWTEFHRFFGGVVRYGPRSTVTLQAYGGPQHDALAYNGIAKSDNEDDEARKANFSSFTEDIERYNQPHVEFFHDWRMAPDWTLKQALFWIRGTGYFDFDGTYRTPDYLRLPESWRDLSADERQQALYDVAPDVPLMFRATVNQWHVGWLPRVTYRHATGETTIGAEARLHRSTHWGRIQEADGIPVDLVGDSDARVYQYSGEKAVGSVFGSHLFRPIERLAVQADVQATYRHYRHYDESFFGRSFRVPYFFVNPRLGVTVNPERPLSGYASVALASREPRMKNYYDGEEAGSGAMLQFEQVGGVYDFDSPLVKPEQLIDVELGGGYTQQRYRLAANVFWMSFQDEIVPSGGVDQFGVPRTGNADRTRHVGLEMEAAARLLPGLDARGNLTLSRNRFTEFTEYVTAPDGSTVAAVQDGNPIAGFPDRIANLGLTYRWSGFTLAADAKFAGEQYIDNSGGVLLDGTRDETLVLDPYALVNASLQYAFPRRSALDGLELSLDVNNVLDDRVLLYGNAGWGTPQFFPTATRHLFASLRYTVR